MFYGWQIYLFKFAAQEFHKFLFTLLCLDRRTHFYLALQVTAFRSLIYETCYSNSRTIENPGDDQKNYGLLKADGVAT